jgi:hypothetical protein
MNFPLGYTGPISGIILGIIFGYVLENAGFGSGCKLTAQLRFKDWAVFKVMFTAIIVASGGLYLMQSWGLVNVVNDMFVPSVFIWAVRSAACALALEWPSAATAPVRPWLPCFLANLMA